MSFLPTDIAGLKLWLRPAGLFYQDTGTATPSVATNDVIGHWADQSGGGHEPVQAAGGNKPLFKLALTNGLNGANFGGAGLFLVAPSGGPTTTHTISMLLNLTSNPAGFCGFGFVSGTSTTNQNSVLGATSAGKLWIGGFGQAGATTQGSVLSTGTWLVLTKTWDGTNANGYLNGTLNVGPVALPYASLAASMGIGAAQSAGTGPIAFNALSMVVYDTALSDPNRVSVETYLSGLLTPAAAGSHNLMLMGCGN